MRDVKSMEKQSSEFLCLLVKAQQMDNVDIFVGSVWEPPPNNEGSLSSSELLFCAYKRILLVDIALAADRRAIGDVRCPNPENPRLFVFSEVWERSNWFVTFAGLVHWVFEDLCRHAVLRHVGQLSGIVNNCKFWI